MKLEITNAFLKDLTKALRKEVVPSFYCEIHNIEISFIEGCLFTLEIAWGDDTHNIHHNTKIYFGDDANIDYIRGMFAQCVHCEEENYEYHI